MRRASRRTPNPSDGTDCRAEWLGVTVAGPSGGRGSGGRVGRSSLAAPVLPRGECARARDRDGPGGLPSGRPPGSGGGQSPWRAAAISSRMLRSPRNSRMIAR
jgi:hypothetical protein